MRLLASGGGRVEQNRATRFKDLRRESASVFTTATYRRSRDTYVRNRMPLLRMSNDLERGSRRCSQPHSVERASAETAETRTCITPDSCPSSHTSHATQTSGRQPCDPVVKAQNTRAATMERRPRSAPAARRVAPIPSKRPGSAQAGDRAAQAWTEAKRRDAKREELLALIEGCGVEPVLEAASQKILKTDPTRAKAALKKLDFAAHAARCGLQKGQPVAAQAALKKIEATATGLHRTVTAMADERDHFKYVAEQLEVRLLGNMRSKQSQIEALTMRVKHDRDALLSTLNSLRERNELLEEQVARLEIDLAGTRVEIRFRTPHAIDATSCNAQFTG